MRSHGKPLSPKLETDTDNRGASLVTQLGKNPPAMEETPVRFLGWEDPLEKGKATHFSILGWRIPWTIYSPWACEELDTTEQLN